MADACARHYGEHAVQDAGARAQDGDEHQLLAVDEPLLGRVTAPLKELVDRRQLTRADVRSLHFLIAHGATAPFSLVPLAERFAGGDLSTTKAIHRHAEFVADVIVGGIEAHAVEGDRHKT